MPAIGETVPIEQINIKSVPLGDTESDAIASDPRFNTILDPVKEAEFQSWKSKYAPKDSGYDYDLRGAFAAGLTPNDANGHWPDKFKKPNHPTFSNESDYAKIAPERAGRWIGEKYIPASVSSAAATQSPPAVGDTVPIESIRRAKPRSAEGQPISDLEILREARRYGADFDAVKASLNGTPVPNATPVNPAAGGIYDIPGVGPVAQGVALGGMQAASFIGNATGLTDRNQTQRSIAQFRQGAEQNNPGMLSTGARTVAEGLTLAAPTMVASTPLGAAGVGAAVFGATAYDRAVYDAEQAGLSPADTAKYVAAVTGLNAAGGLVPGFAGAGGKAMARAVAKGAIANVALTGGELAARSAFDVNAPETWSDATKELLVSAAMGGSFTLPASLRASLAKGNALTKARAVREIAKQARADKATAAEVARIGGTTPLPEEGIIPTAPQEPMAPSAIQGIAENRRATNVSGMRDVYADVPVPEGPRPFASIDDATLMTLANTLRQTGDTAGQAGVMREIQIRQQRYGQDLAPEVQAQVVEAEALRRQQGQQDAQGEAYPQAPTNPRIQGTPLLEGPPNSTSAQGLNPSSVVPPYEVNQPPRPRAVGEPFVVGDEPPAAPSLQQPRPRRVMDDLPMDQQASLIAMRDESQKPITAAQVKSVVGGTRESVKAIRDEINTPATETPIAPVEASQPLDAPNTSPEAQSSPQTAPAASLGAQEADTAPPKWTRGKDAITTEIDGTPYRIEKDRDGTRMLFAGSDPNPIEVNIPSVKAAQEAAMQRARPDLNDPRSGAVDLSVMAELPAAAGKEAKRLAQRYLTSRGDKPQKAFDILMKAGHLKNAILAEGQDAIADIKRAASTEGVTDLQSIDRYVKGDSTVPLPPKTKAAADKQRALLDNLSQKAVNEGVVTGDMASVFKSGMGIWVKRSYRIFDEGREWIDKVKQDRALWGNAVAETNKAYFGGTNPAAAEGYLAAQLESYADKSKGGKFGAAASTEGAMNVSSLNRRKDIPEAIRKVMGEYTDPTINFARSLESLADMVTNHEALTNIRRAGLQDGWLKTEPQGEFATQITGKGNRRTAPLTEGDPIYTTREIADAMDRQFSDRSQGSIVTGYRMLNTLARTSATALSTASQARNFITGPLLVGRLGVDVKGVVSGKMLRDMGTASNIVARKPIEAIKFAAEKFGYAPDMKKVEFYRNEARKLRELGILDTDITMGQLRDNFNDVSKGGPIAKAVTGATRKGFNAAGSAYQGGDNFWKTIAFYNLKRLHEGVAKSEGWTPQQLDENVARIIRNEVPNYDMLGDAMKAFKDLPIRPDFIAWPAERVRNSYNTLQRIQNDIRSSNPERRKMAINAIISMATATTAPAALAAYTMHKNDVTTEKDEAFRRTYAFPWMKDAPIYYMQSDDGSVRVIDGGFTSVDNAITGPAMAMLSGEDWEDSFTKTMESLMTDYGNPGIVAEALIDIARNKTKDGRPVWLEGDTREEVVKAQTQHLAKAFTPGVIKSMERVTKGYMGIEDRGRKYDTQDEITAMLGGLRFYNIDLAQGTTRVFRDKKNDLSQQSRVYRENVENRSVVPEVALEQYNAGRAAIVADMHQSYLDAKTLGVDDAKLRQAMKDASLTKAEMQQVMSGKFVAGRAPGEDAPKRRTGPPRAPRRPSNPWTRD